jgi:hypothetical protein
MLIMADAVLAAQWPQHLYLGRGDYWRQRIPVVVTHAGSTAVEGASVEVQSGAPAGSSAATSPTAMRSCTRTASTRAGKFATAASAASAPA